MRVERKDYLAKVGGVFTPHALHKARKGRKIRAKNQPRGSAGVGRARPKAETGDHTREQPESSTAATAQTPLILRSSMGQRASKTWRARRRRAENPQDKEKRVHHQREVTRRAKERADSQCRTSTSEESLGAETEPKDRKRHHAAANPKEKRVLARSIMPLGLLPFPTPECKRMLARPLVSLGLLPFPTPREGKEQRERAVEEKASA